MHVHACAHTQPFIHTPPSATRSVSLLLTSTMHRKMRKTDKTPSLRSCTVARSLLPSKSRFYYTPPIWHRLSFVTDRRVFVNKMKTAVQVTKGLKSHWQTSKTCKNTAVWLSSVLACWVVVCSDLFWANRFQYSCCFSHLWAGRHGGIHWAFYYFPVFPVHHPFLSSPRSSLPCPSPHFSAMRGPTPRFCFHLSTNATFCFTWSMHFSPWLPHTSMSSSPLSSMYICLCTLHCRQRHCMDGGMNGWVGRCWEEWQSVCCCNGY